MSGKILDYKKHLSLQIGQYCQVHEEDYHRNSQNSITKGAISLGPSGNLQGGFKFMALNTGKKIVTRSWDVILMPDTVITRVNALGRDQPVQFILPINVDVQSATSKSQEWTLLTPTILRFQEWMHHTLTLIV